MSYYAVVGDIGGTNARFALVEEGSVELAHVEVFSCNDFSNFDLALQAYYEKVGVEPLPIACISFACPVGEDIKMTNNHWAFNVRDMQRKLALTKFELLNDFTAMAYGTLYIEESAKVLIQAGNPELENNPRLVIGPGTGLGVSSLIPKKQDTAKNAASAIIDWQAVATEGGHVSFAPVNALQDQILAIFRQQYQRVSVERILSGDGIVALYTAICAIKGCEQVLASAAQITAAAITDEDPLAVLTLETFCEVLGAVVGDIVLAQGARGGVYLCGGILPRVQEFLLASQFRVSMADKGRFTRYLEQVPVWLCDAQYPGLLGSAAALKIHG